MGVSVAEAVDEIPHKAEVFGNIFLGLERLHQSVR